MKKKTYKKKQVDPSSVDPAIVAQIRAQVIADLANAKKVEDDQQAAIKAAADKAHSDYVAQMYASKEPWVEIQSWTDTPQGARIELDWNDAFIAHLRANGFTGANEDQIAQKYLALLTQQATESIEEKQQSTIE